jgi:hypothetical protein
MKNLVAGSSSWSWIKSNSRSTSLPSVHATAALLVFAQESLASGESPATAEPLNSSVQAHNKAATRIPALHAHHHYSTKFVVEVDFSAIPVDRASAPTG